MGGYFIWVQLTKDINENIVDLFKKQGVGIKLGNIFSCNENFKNCLRLSFAHYEENQLEEGVKRLSKVLKQI